MRKGKTFEQLLDIILKVFGTFLFVFILYIISKKTNSFAYDYFIFPFISIIFIFMCGVNVGKCLEKIKRNEEIGFFTKNKKKKNQTKEIQTEFTINGKTEILPDKKILKEVKENDTIHIKVFNYDDVIGKEK